VAAKYFIVCITSLTIFVTACNAQNTKNKKVTTQENCGNIKNKDSKNTAMETGQLNVLGTPLQLASKDPLTGFFRTGYCATDANDRGVHVVAAVVTDEFLQYSFTQGNDLISAHPANGFPGLKAGNVWCLCALRWKEAVAANVAPPVLLEATNIKALEYVSLEELKQHAVK
jgi:uncharacterized protein